MDQLINAIKGNNREESLLAALIAVILGAICTGAIIDGISG